MSTQQKIHSHISNFDPNVIKKKWNTSGIKTVTFYNDFNKTEFARYIGMHIDQQPVERLEFCEDIRN